MTRKEITQLFTRFLITFACMLPVLFGIGFLLKNKVSDFVMVVIFVVVAGTAVAIEELYQKRQMLKQQNQNYKQDNNNGGKK